MLYGIKACTKFLFWWKLWLDRCYSKLKFKTEYEISESYNLKAFTKAFYESSNEGWSLIYIISSKYLKLNLKFMHTAQKLSLKFNSYESSALVFIIGSNYLYLKFKLLISKKLSPNLICDESSNENSVMIDIPSNPSKQISKQIWNSLNLSFDQSSNESFGLGSKFEKPERYHNW